MSIDFKKKRKRKELLTFSGFIFPALFAFIIIIIVPFFIGIYYSFTNWQPGNTSEFIGIENYVTAFKDPGFLYSFFVTVIYTISAMLVINVVALGLALLVTRKLKLSNVYRAGYFIPNLIGGLVLGYLWKFIFNQALPLIGKSLVANGFDFGSFFVDNLFLNDQKLSIFAMVIVASWQYIGYIMVIYVAAIQNVPQDLIEASQIDGATMKERFRHIIFPMIAPAFTISSFLTLANSFKQFDINFALTNGGPSIRFMEANINSSELLALNIFKTGSVDINQGLAQSKAVIFFVVLLIVSLIQVSKNKKKEVQM